MSQLEMSPLPYPVTALEPYIKRFSVDQHRAFQAQYVATVNERAGDFPKSDLLELAMRAAAAGDEKLSHAAAQVWNHDFYWASMRPVDGSLGVPDGPLGNLIHKQFGGLANLKNLFIQAGLDQFGSGWVWLTLQRGRQIVIQTTSNAENPLLSHNIYPLLCCDVWEHAWIPDYSTDREFYLSTWFDMMANFVFASDNARWAMHGR